jgi:hypothetical protein
MNDIKKFKTKKPAVGRVRFWSAYLTSALLLGIVSLTAILLWLTLFHKKMTSEDIIVSKLSPVPVPSKFTPVLLYSSVGKESAVLAGSGSLYAGREGEHVVTNEHFFREGLADQRFTWRKLRPPETVATRGIEKVLTTGSELSSVPGVVPDVVILKSGQSKRIRSFSKLPPEETKQQFSIAEFDPPLTITSLLSGEKVRVLGTATYGAGKGVSYAVLEYGSTSGESGSGFVDENDDLYVLKGPLIRPSPESDEIIGKFFGSAKSLTLLYGPLHSLR